MLCRGLVVLGRGSFRRFYSGDEAVSVTALYQFHKDNGGKMVNFGGFMLPMQYNDLSIINSHLHTRQSASLFDVSHMLQTEITGRDCIKYLESLCTADIGGLEDNSSVLTVFTNEKGGILDDLIVTKINTEHLFVVSNASRKNHDRNHLIDNLQHYRRRYPRTNIKLSFLEPQQRSLLALQGPRASVCLQKLTDINLSKLYFMKSADAKVAGVGSCRITRCGYTGEDGFEISIPSVLVTELVREILKDEQIKLAGLGARDSLRLEAGLCLYGSDITENTTPTEASLSWLVSKRRRQEGNFPGAPVILKQIKQGTKQKRVGLISEDGPPARQGTVILDESGKKELGKVTSGCPAPSLSKNIAMGYVPTEFSKVGTKVCVKIRDKIFKAVIAKMPFAECHYYTNK